MTAARIEPEKDATSAAARYRGIELRAAETERDRKLKARVAELRQRFVDGPVLILPGTGSGTFDIRGAVAIPGSGTVYFSNYRKAGDWGEGRRVHRCVGVGRSRNTYSGRSIPYGGAHTERRRLDCNTGVWMGRPFGPATVRFPGRP